MTICWLSSKAFSGTPDYAESANHSRSCNGSQFKLPLNGSRFTRHSPELGIVAHVMEARLIAGAIGTTDSSVFA